MLYLKGRPTVLRWHSSMRWCKRKKAGLVGPVPVGAGLSWERGLSSLHLRGALYGAMHVGAAVSRPLIASFPIGTPAFTAVPEHRRDFLQHGKCSIRPELHAFQRQCRAAVDQPSSAQLYWWSSHGELPTTHMFCTPASTTHARLLNMLL
jgi:hypothetical protein